MGLNRARQDAMAVMGSTEIGLQAVRDVVCTKTKVWSDRRLSGSTSRNATVESYKTE